MKLVINVPIGAVDITASRESLSFVEITVTNLKKIFTDILEVIDDRIYNELDAVKSNSWDMSGKYVELCNTFGSNLVRRCQLLEEDAFYSNSHHEFLLNVTENDYLLKKQDDVNLYSIDLAYRRTISPKVYSHFPFSWNKPSVNTNTTVIVNDSGKGFTPILRLFAQNNNAVKQILVIDFRDRKNKYSTRVVNRVLKELGNPRDVRYVSDLPKPERTKVAMTKELRVSKVNYLDESYYEPQPRKMLFKDLEADKPVYYVNLSRKTVNIGNFEYSLNEVRRTVSNVFPTLWQEITVCGFTKHEALLLKRANVEVVMLEDMLADKINEITADKIGYASRGMRTPDPLNNEHVRKANDEGKITSETIRNILRMAHETRQQAEGIDYHNISKLARMLNVELDLDFETVKATADAKAEKFNELVQEVYKQAPMCQYFHPSWSSDSDAYNTLIEYFNQNVA